MMVFRAALVLGLAAALARADAQTARAQSTLQRIRSAHELACGVVQEDAEYSTEEDHSSRGAFDSALCQAFAIAADAAASVKVTSFLDETSALDALRKGQLDVIASLSADTMHPAKGVRLSRPIFYDSLALLAPVASGAKRPQDLAGKKICVLAETGAEEALRAWFLQRHIDYLPFPFQEEGEMEAAYMTNNCAALAAERTRLALIRLSLGGAESGHAVLPEPLSRDAMAAATTAADGQWAHIVDVVAGTLLLAEKLGITSENVDLPPNGNSVTAALQLRGARKAGMDLGLRVTWAADVLRSTGNYRQMFERTLGGGSDRHLPSDLNRLRSEGGWLVPFTAP